MLTRPHSWKSIRQQLLGGKLRIFAEAKATAQHVAELDKEIADLLAEAKAISDNAAKEDRDLTAKEVERLDAILGDIDDEEGEVYKLKAERSRVEKVIALKKRAASEFDAHARGTRSPLDGPEEGGRREDRRVSTSTVTFRAEDGRTIRSLGLSDPFCARASQHSDDQPRYSLGDRIAAHLGVRPMDSIQGSVWEGTDGAGGYLTGVETFGQVIDLARAASVAFAAGAQTIPMRESELLIVQQLTDPTASWTPELAKVAGSRPTFGRIRLVPKKLACIVPVSIEVLEDAANAAQLIQSAIVNAMALKLDQAILSGTGTGEEPLGIRSLSNVNSVTVSAPPAVDYIDLESAIEKIRLANYVGEDSSLSWVRHPRDAAQYNKLQDTLLQPLQPTPGAAALKKFQTTSLPINLGGGAESEMICGDFSQVVVGLRTNATVRFLPAGSVTVGAETFDAAEQFGALIAVHMRADVAVIRPQWLTVIDGVSWS